MRRRRATEHESSQALWKLLPLLGERAGVRASVSFNLIFGVGGSFFSAQQSEPACVGCYGSTAQGEPWLRDPASPPRAVVGRPCPCWNSRAPVRALCCYGTRGTSPWITSSSLISRTDSTVMVPLPTPPNAANVPVPSVHTCACTATLWTPTGISIPTQLNDAAAIVRW